MYTVNNNELVKLSVIQGKFDGLLSNGVNVPKERRDMSIRANAKWVLKHTNSAEMKTLMRERLLTLLTNDKIRINGKWATYVERTKDGVDLVVDFGHNGTLAMVKYSDIVDVKQL